MNESGYFLVSHGCAAALSRCRDDAGLRPGRGEPVVLRGARGEELGAVLCEAPAGGAEAFGPAELVRRATRDDLVRADEVARRARDIANDAQRFIDQRQLPLLTLDADLPLDADSVVVHVLRWSPCTLTPLIEELRGRHGLEVYLLDRSQAPAESGCGSGSCGSCGEGGGCSSGCGSGNCSRGATAKELTAYFAELRDKMSARGRMSLA